MSDVHEGVIGSTPEEMRATGSGRKERKDVRMSDVRIGVVEVTEIDLVLAERRDIREGGARVIGRAWGGGRAGGGGPPTGANLSDEGSSAAPRPGDHGGPVMVEPEGPNLSTNPRPSWAGGLRASACRMMGIGSSLEGPSATLSSEGIHLTARRLPDTRERAHICLRGPKR